MLLLVDDEQSEVAELRLLGQQRMGADDDVDRPVREPLAGLGRLLRRDEARQLAHLDRKAAEALHEPDEVLARKQRGGRNHGDLLAGHRRDEGRAHGDLRLAEADVAADQPVHRHPGVQVGQDVLDGRQLVLRLLVGKARAKRVPHVVGRLEDRRRAQHPLGRDPDQAVRDLADPRLHPGLLRLPGAAAELVEDPLVVAVAAQEFDVLDGQVEAVSTLVFEVDHLVGGAERVHHLETDVAPDAVIHMYDHVLGAEALVLGQEILGATALPPRAARRAGHPAHPAQR